MSFADPFWLVLGIPLAMSLWFWPLPSRLMVGLRAAALALLLLSLCGLSLWLPTRSGTVVLVADRSLSMPSESAALQREAADIIYSAKRSDDKFAVVSFAESAVVEQSPEAGKFAGFSADVGRDASRLADALDVSLSLIGRDEPGRILVLSDGRWTGRDITPSAMQAAANGVAIDYRGMDRPAAGELAVERIEGPESVAPGESYMVTAWIHSSVTQPVRYELRRGSQVIARGTQSVVSGTSRLLFRDIAAEQGVCDYVLRVEGQNADPVPENNRARLLVGVRGSRPILCVSPTGNSGLASLLAKGRLNVVSRAASQCNWTLEELAGYSAILFENTPAGQIGHVGMENVAAWVSQSGGGLMLSGGRDGFGPGGYYKSPLEPILPVSLELRREHRKLSLAIVVALDRSGSMACLVPGGRAKMDLADLATAEVVDMLGPLDQFGCIAVDSVVHEIVPLTDVVDKSSMRSRILSIDSAGGGIFIYEALAAAAKMVVPATAGTRHIVLFADAADSEEPGDYPSLVAKCRAAGMTISVVGLGTEKDCDAELLKDIARRGGGQCMFTNIAQELPRLFAQDTFLVARSAFLEDPVHVRPTGGLTAITRQSFGEFPAIGGYNLCYLRPEANLDIVSVDEYKAPIVSSWQSGLGRVLCYTGEADGKYTGAMAGWKNVGDFFASLARWTSGKSQGLGHNVVATQELRDGICRVELHLDPARESAPFLHMPELKVLSANPGHAATTKTIAMNWASADTLLAEVPLTGGETVLPTLSALGVGQVTLAPVCLPYSPEYAPQKPGRGLSSLEFLAKTTGGCQRLNLADVWNDLPKKPRQILLTPYLLLAAVVVFLLEVLQRRTGILSIRWKALRVLKGLVTGRDPNRTPVASEKKRKEKKPTGLPQKPSSGAPQPSPVDKPPVDSGIASALRRAQQRARQRTDRDE